MHRSIECFAKDPKYTRVILVIGNTVRTKATDQFVWNWGVRGRIIYIYIYIYVYIY